MPPKSPFIVPVREMPTSRSITVDGAFVSSALAGLAVRDALDAPKNDPDAGHGQGEFSLNEEGTMVFVSGTMSGSVRVACSRCVEPMDIGFDEKVMVTFMLAADMPNDDALFDSPADSPADAADTSEAADDHAGVEIAEGDVDLFPYDGEQVDLEPLFREQFILTVPYAPVCKDDCQGLCPQCGNNRNVSTCNCEKPMDPRFAGLRNLKLPV